MWVAEWIALRTLVQEVQVRILLEAEFAHDCTVLCCTETFIIMLLSFLYDLTNVERDVKHQTIIIIIIVMRNISAVFVRVV